MFSSRQSDSATAERLAAAAVHAREESGGSPGPVGEARARGFGPIAYAILRFPLAALLVGAAYLKMQELLTPAGDPGRLWRTVLVEAEWLLAVWLLSGVWAVRAWGVSLTCFVVFSAYSLFQALQGAESCGCFGSLPTSPWLTLSLDLFVVAMLLVFPPQREILVRPNVRKAVAAVAAAVALGAGLPAGYAMLNYESGRLLPDGTIVGDVDHVDFEPEEWVGQPFPLFAHIDVGDQLREGRWTLMFHYHRCKACHDGLARLLDQAAAYPDRELLERIVLVEVPPLGPEGLDAPLRRWFKTGRLSPERAWLMPVPTVMQLRDGLVTSATAHGTLALPPPPTQQPATRTSEP